MLQRDEGFGVAEKVGDGDEQVLEQRPRLVAVVGEVVEVARHAVRTGDLDAPLDAPEQRGALVLVEAVARALVQRAEDLAEDLGARGVHQVVLWREDEPVLLA